MQLFVSSSYSLWNLIIDSIDLFQMRSRRKYLLISLHPSENESEVSQPLFATTSVIILRYDSDRNFFSVSFRQVV
jgi:hypothetical protein